MATMIDNVSRLELLRMAREMVINEHIDRRAELHNKWVAESEEVWALRRQRLPYPSIPPYPTEVDVVNRACTLLSFMSSDVPKPPGPPPEDQNSSQPINNVNESETMSLVQSNTTVNHIEEDKNDENFNTDSANHMGHPYNTSVDHIKEDKDNDLNPNSTDQLPSESVIDNILKVKTDSISNNNQSKSPEEIEKERNDKILLDSIKYARNKVQLDLEDNTTTASRIIPMMIKKLEKMRNNTK